MRHIPLALVVTTALAVSCVPAASAQTVTTTVVSETAVAIVAPMTESAVPFAESEPSAAPSTTTAPQLADAPYYVVTMIPNEEA